MKKVNKIKYLFLGLITTLSFVCIGNAAFWNTEIKNVSGTPTTDSSSYIPVCYAGNKTYRSIEAAIADVGTPSTATTIYVYPNLTNYDGSRRTVYINSDITINNKVTLCLPYSGTKYDAGDSWNSEKNSDGNVYSKYYSFADTNNPTKEILNESGELMGWSNYNLTKARKTLVKINEGVTLTIESGGKLIVGGQSGFQNQYNVSGCVSGDFAELRLANNASIIAKNNSTITCFGYIKKDPTTSDGVDEMIELQDGSSLHTMLTLYDFKGGTRTTNLLDRNIMPFYLYDITHLQLKIKINAGAKIFARVRFEVSIIGINEEVQFFGKDSSNDANSLFLLKSGYAYYEYKPSDSTRQTTDIHGITQVDVYGDCTFNKMYLTKSYIIKDVTINTTLYDFPINHKYRFFFNNNSNLDVTNNIKLLPGSELVINDGSTLNIATGKRIMVYSDYKYATQSAAIDTRWYSNSQSVSLPGAKLLINGNVNGGGTIVGSVLTSSSSGVLDARNFYALSSDVKEVPDAEYNSAVSGTYPSTLTLKGPTSSTGTITNLEKNKYLSKGTYWEIDASAALENSASIDYSSENGLTLSDGKYSTGKGAGGSIVLTANVSTYNPVSSYAWTVNNSGGTLSSSSSASTTLTINANNSTNSVDDVVVTLVVTFAGGQPPSITKESLPFVRTKKDSTNPCFETGTLVLTNNGEKPIEQLNENDLLVSFNHFTGEYEYTKIGSLVFHGNNCYDVIELNFNDGTYIGFIDNHGLFDLDLNKYIDITIDNYEQYIGHRFAKYDEGTTKVVTLNNINITKKYTGSYSVFGNEHINCVAEGLLTLPTALYGLYNIFDYSENMMYDSEMVKRDIEQYGLFSYEEFKDIIPYNIFEAFGFKYFKVSIGKGFMTYEQLIGYIEWFFDIAKEGGVLIGL